MSRRAVIGWSDSRRGVIGWSDSRRGVIGWSDISRAVIGWSGIVNTGLSKPDGPDWFDSIRFILFQKIRCQTNGSRTVVYFKISPNFYRRKI